MSSLFRRSLLVAAFAGTLVALDAAARACGCMAPPDPTVSILQAGEKIVFAVTNSQVTAHIQIQYTGDAKDFGWILPVSAVPTLELGTDELFTQLTSRTAPTWYATYTYQNSCFLGTPADAAAAASDLGVAGPNPLVLQDSIGPYDYAVLKADDKTAMLNWLATNRYLIPAGTDTVVAPYIHPGGFFLALKLKSGQTSGSIQPIVVHYNSDLPMIPITLTSVAAQPNMGIWVWMLGDSRAIPRNYHHVIPNDAQIAWLGGGYNYENVVTRAVAEAPAKHAFVTEFAGSSAFMKGVLDSPGRFGKTTDLAKITDAGAYTSYLRNQGYPFTVALISILQKYIAMPPMLVNQGIQPAQYYYNLSYYRQTQPGAFQGVNLSFDSAALTADIQSRIIVPTLAAGALFSAHPYMTRLHTVLSPADMNSDPVFSYNPSLPDVSNLHTAAVNLSCAASGSLVDENIQTPQGFHIELPFGNPNALPTMPYSLHIETLRESGPPMVVTDNRPLIEAALQKVLSPDLAMPTVDAAIQPMGNPDTGVNPVGNPDNGVLSGRDLGVTPGHLDLGVAPDADVPPPLALDRGCDVAPGVAAHGSLLGLGLLALVAMLLTTLRRLRLL